MGTRAKPKLEVKDRGFKRAMDRAKSLAKSPNIKIGVLDGEHNDDGVTNAEVAFWMEFGTIDGGGNVPARPFMRRTYAANQAAWAKLGVKLMIKVVEGKLEIDQALELLGARAVADTRKTITSGAGVPPPNAPSTIAAKGSSRPLVDTGTLLNSITWGLAT